MSATIRYTAYGIPHITATDYAGLVYGTGCAAARDKVIGRAPGLEIIKLKG